MSDIEYQLQQMAEQAGNEVSRLIGRGDYYSDRGENAEALKNYISALKAYANYAKRKSEIISVSVAISTQDIDRTNAQIIFSQTLFELFTLLKLISDLCKSDSILRVYLESRLVKISAKLDEYERVFDENELKKYENIRNYARSVESNVHQHKDLLNSLKPIKEESNEALKIIRESLSEISSAKICPLTLEESGGCFIATAAYSTPTHPDLDTFRAFRDEKLLTHWIGNKLVKIYYQLSPSVAEYINQKPRIKRFVRRQLESLATWMRNQGITKN